jgi:hypothetical protein
LRALYAMMRGSVSALVGLDGFVITAQLLDDTSGAWVVARGENHRAQRLVRSRTTSYGQLRRGPHQGDGVVADFPPQP